MSPTIDDDTTRQIDRPGYLTDAGAFVLTAVALAFLAVVVAGIVLLTIGLVSS